MVILGYVGTIEAGNVLIDSIRRPLGYLRKAWRYAPVDGRVPPLEESMSSMVYLALCYLGAMKHPGLVEDAFALLGTAPVPHDVVRIKLLQYLAQVAPVDPEILPRLRALLDNQSSPLHDDFQLRRKVEFLEKQKGASGRSPDTP